VRGRWRYLYRAIDRDGALVDVMLREHRDLAAAKAFFRSPAGRRQGRRAALTLTESEAASRLAACVISAALGYAKPCSVPAPAASSR
jgi:transposase-like protein